MKTRSIISALAAVSAFTGCHNAPINGGGHPNVLLILTDDQGWGDVCIHGNPNISTPAIDRLYSESAVMNRFMVSPLSAPTRASLLTGRYHLRTGVCSVQGGLENMNPDETTIAELFKDAGYSTGCFGKWHNGAYYPYTPNGQGFDEFLGFCCGHWANYFNPELQHNETMFYGEGYSTDIFTDAAIEFIKEHKDSPFFCYVPYNAPHSPYQVPDKYFDHYYKNLPVKNDADRASLAAIYGMVECVDYNISRLLSTLDELKIRENTIVIYMSDNGPTHIARYNGEMRGGKATVREGGVRVPCYINWEGHIRHRVIDELYAHIDMLPTLMDLCGIKKYKTAFPTDGVSMKNALMGKEYAGHDRQTFTHRGKDAEDPSIGACRTKGYRLEVYPGGRVEMYDMISDRSERHNIYDRDNPEHQKLYEAYMEWFDIASKGVAGLYKPVPVGYDAAPEVRIPTPEGKPSGRLKCYGFPNQNWMNHFMSESDSLSFTLDVVSEGDYTVSVAYSNTDTSGNVLMCADVGGTAYEASMPVFTSERRYSPDRVPRGEAPDMTWGRLPIAVVHLSEGENKIKIFAKGVQGESAVRIKTLLINKVLQ